MKLKENRDDVIGWFSTGADPGSWVLDVLEFFIILARMLKKGIAIINAESDKCVDQDFSAGLGQWWVESGDVAKVDKGGSGNAVNVRGKWRVLWESGGVSWDTGRGDFEPMRRASVLLEFNYRKFLLFQFLMSSTQVVRDKGGMSAVGLEVM